MAARTVLGLAAILTLAGVTRLASSLELAAPLVVTKHYDWDMPGIEKPTAWFARKDVHGLAEADGNLLLDGKKLERPRHLRPRVAAALYTRRGLLVSVQSDGSADLYKQVGETWKLHSRLAPDVECRNESVRLTIVPGLVYLLNYDAKKEARLKSSVVSLDDYADISRRLCLTESAERFHAVPLQNRYEPLLGAAYREPGPGEKNVMLCTSEHDAVNIDVAGTLAAPFRSGPGDDLAQSLFIEPSLGIAALTADGWSICDSAGKNLGKCSTAAITGGWWSDPTYHDGHFYVHFRTGPGGTTYRVDPDAGKLVEEPKP